MVCYKCGYKYSSKINMAVKADDHKKVTVCPNCGHEEEYLLPLDEEVAGKREKRFKLSAPSKKWEFLLEKISEIPDVDEICSPTWASSLKNGVPIDHRYNTENAILMVLEMVTKGTRCESLGRELSDKARKVFDFYSNEK